jgi:hypothetical protein
MSCDRMPGCGVVLDVLVSMAVRNDQCFGTGSQSAVHLVHLITSWIAMLRQGPREGSLELLKSTKTLGGSIAE